MPDVNDVDPQKSTDAKAVIERRNHIVAGLTVFGIIALVGAIYDHAILSQSGRGIVRPAPTAFFGSSRSGPEESAASAPTVIADRRDRSSPAFLVGATSDTKIPESAPSAPPMFVSVGSWHRVQCDVSEDVGEEALSVLDQLIPLLAERFKVAVPDVAQKKFSVTIHRSPATYRKTVPSQFANYVGSVAWATGELNLIYSPCPYEFRRVLIHEATHQFVFSLHRSGRGRVAPHWWSEGICHDIEAHRFVDGKLEIGTEDRAVYWHWWDLAANVLARGEPLRAIISGFRQPNVDEDGTRALARGMVRFFRAGPGRKYSAWYEELEARMIRDGGIGRSRFFEQLGVDEAVLAKEMEDWFRSMRPIGDVVIGEWVDPESDHPETYLGSNGSAFLTLPRLADEETTRTSFEVPLDVDRDVQFGYFAAFKDPWHYVYVIAHRESDQVEVGRVDDEKVVSKIVVQWPVANAHRLGIAVDDRCVRALVDDAEIATLDLREGEVYLPLGLHARAVPGVFFPPPAADAPFPLNQVVFRGLARPN